MYKITKTYTSAEGLSACFRQWRAKDTHCRFVHGYSLEISVGFIAHTLDDRNWVWSFGELKEFKEWLKQTFDHKTLIAASDPEIQTFIDLHDKDIIQLVILPEVGCEMFAEYIFRHISNLITSKSNNRVQIEFVKVSEHAGNSATYLNDNLIGCCS